MLIYLTMIDSQEDQNKFVKIYNHYKDYLQYLALSLLDNADDAEDVVQETFYYIAKNIKKVKVAISPQTTVFVSLICEHKAINTIRDRLKYAETDLDSFTDGIASEYTTGSKLGDAMLKLKAEDRQMLFLRFSYGFSISEIAKMMNKSYNATQRMILRAKHALEDKLKEVE